MPDLATTRHVARRLWNVIEPIASSVYFVPEAQAAYARLGLEGFGPSYFCSRSACMGQVPGEVVAATFAVFNPAVVLPAVEAGWAVTTPDAILAARLEGATGGLARMLAAATGGREGGSEGGDAAARARATELLVRAGDAAAAHPSGYVGRPLFAGLHSLGLPGDGDLGDLWRAADVLREHRGDSHVLAWAAMGLSAVEVTLLTELWWGGRTGRYIRTRGWDDAAIAEGLASLQDRGFVSRDEEPAFTTAGEEVRAVIEEMTDKGETVVVAALGDDAEELLGLLQPIAAAVIEAKGYPRDPAALPRAE